MSPIRFGVQPFSLAEREGVDGEGSSVPLYPLAGFFLRTTASVSLDEGPEDQPHPPEPVAHFATVIVLSAVADVGHRAHQVGQLPRDFVSEVGGRQVQAVGDSACEQMRELVSGPGRRRKEFDENVGGEGGVHGIVKSN